MATPARRRVLAIIAVSATLAILAWLLTSGSFAHGVIVGALGAITLLFTVVDLLAQRFARRAAKRAGGRLPPPPLPVDSWDYSLPLEDLSGRPFAFANAAGSVIVLNFWATWCAPCVAEMPSLRRLLAATRDLDVRFGFVSREPREVVGRFVAKHGFELPIYVLAGELPPCFATRGIPATFVIDRHGMIALRHVGAAAWDAERVVNFVRGLAAVPSEPGAD
jgi:thiol-disulfide isomerase/thioredoxin